MNLRVEDILGAYHKLIMDPVHSGIPLQQHEVAIVDHPLFQRLRFICQNDILSLVFPGATHSRFLHSIGTMHVGGRMFKAMIENRLKSRSHYGGKNLRGEGLSGTTLEAISYFSRLLRCACLLHDSGHCSFSHQFNRTPAIQKLLAKNDLFKVLWHQLEPTFAYPTTPEKLEHEHYSIRVAHKILTDISIENTGLQTNDILSLMETTKIVASKCFTRHADALWPLICPDQTPPPERFADQLQKLLSSLVSGELDADRADYMLRDGFHSSVTIGGFNLDHLLSNLHFGWCPQTQWFGLAIAEKGMGSLEDFVYSRHQMYRQVYAHKTAQGFDWLLRAAIDEVMTQKDILTFVDQCLSDIIKFKKLTDSYFWEAFRRYADQHANSYSGCILERVKMPHIITRLNLTADEEQHYLEFLARERNLTQAQIVSSSITARFTKIKTGFDAIKVLVNDSQSLPPTFKLISDTSQFFAKFSDDRITHFYINPVHSKDCMSA